MRASGNLSLLAAGIGSALLALLHAVIIAIGPSGYRYFGAGDLAPLAESGSPIPALITSGLILIFGVWALWAFSGAGLIRRLPLLRTGLTTIGIIYTLRGAMLFPELLLVARGNHPAPRMAIFSAVSLLIGICYLVGSFRLIAHMRGENVSTP